uniref:G-protein coupled receptors family 1 profile domain-containing protein n=1 Tax=Strongyloides stercoralis TaxID=6248 RepID=A0A0K0E7N8_STRER
MLNSTFCLFGETFYLNNISNQIIYGLQTILAFICLFLYITICINLYLENRFEISTKLLLNGLCFSIVLISFGTLIPSIYFLQTIFLQAKENFCLWIDFTGENCALFYSCYNLGQIIFLFFPAFLAIERLICELKYTGKYIGTILFLLQVSIPVGIFIYLYPNNTLKDHFPHCSINSQMFFRSKSLFNMLMAIQLFSLFIYTSLLYNRNNYYNNKKLINDLVLSSGKKEKIKLYQQWRVWDDTELTLPIIIVSTICFLSTVFIEYSFVIAILPYIKFLNFFTIEPDNLIEAAKWNEIQVLLCMLFLIFMGMFLYSKIRIKSDLKVKSCL